MISAPLPVLKEGNLSIDPLARKHQERLKEVEIGLYFLRLWNILQMEDTHKMKQEIYILIINQFQMELN